MTIELTITTTLMALKKQQRNNPHHLQSAIVNSRRLLRSLLSGPRQFLATEKPFKNDEKFLFRLYSSFRSETFKVLF